MNARTMLFRLSTAVALAAGLTLPGSAQVEPAGAVPAGHAAPVAGDAEVMTWSTGVRYSYDGAGNVHEIGTDTFKYDAVGRLVESKANGIRRNYAYDRYGNRTQCVQGQGTPSQSDCQYGYSIDAAANRIAGVTYDGAGNLHKIGTHTYTYDALNALIRDDVGATPREYVYDANGERIAVYEVNAGKWRWTFRDPSGKVLREFTSTGNGTANWKWSKDYIWRDGLLLATRQIEPGKTTAVTYHYHLDHLGTPRRITDDADRIVGIHDYHAFGPEVSGGQNEPALSVMKFTGHERDTTGLDSWDTLDYMHARYYNGTLGRFLSVDPAPDSVLLGMPQSWNRYSYALNNPINVTDPSGRYPCRYKLTGSDAEIAGVADGTVVDGECVEAEADKTASESMMAWLEGHEDILGTAGNAATGFADTVTLTGTKHLREYMGDDQVVDPCSAAYIGGEIGGTVWWTAFGGAVGGRIGGGNLAARELGQITVTDYAARGFGAMSNAQKLDALGGASGATMQALRNVVSAQWWKAVAGTTMSTGPTPAAWGGLAGLGVGSATTGTSITKNCT